MPRDYEEVAGVAAYALVVRTAEADLLVALGVGALAKVELGRIRAIPLLPLGHALVRTPKEHFVFRDSFRPPVGHGKEGSVAAGRCCGSVNCLTERGYFAVVKRRVLPRRGGAVCAA